jgi:hypothetical protein
MRDNAGSNVMGLARPRSSIREILNAEDTPPPVPEAKPVDEIEGKPPALEALIPLPQPGDPYEAAYARPGPVPLPTLRFLKGEGIRGLPYANLDSIDWLPSEKPGGSPSIVLRFSGLIPREAIIAGRHLLKLYDLLAYHRVAWVRELPPGRDFRDVKETVITGITLGPITELPA